MDIVETPSRILRRIRDNEANNDDLPSLPSLSYIDADPSASASFHRPVANLHAAKGFSESEGTSGEEDNDATPGPPAAKRWATPVQSTPIGGDQSRTFRRPTPGSSGSRVRFANSIRTRSFGASRIEGEDGSFDASRISYIDAEEGVDVSTEQAQTSRASSKDGSRSRSQEIRSVSRSSGSAGRLSEVDLNDTQEYEYSHSRSGDSIPAVYLPDSDDEERREGVSIVSASQPASPSGSPVINVCTSKSYVEYDTRVKSEPRASPFDPSRWGNNISRRKQPRQRQVSATESQSEEDTSISTPDVQNTPLPALHTSISATSQSEIEGSVAQMEPGSYTDADRTAQGQRRRSTPSVTFSTPSSLDARSPPAKESPLAKAFNSPASPRLAGRSPQPQSTTPIPSPNATQRSPPAQQPPNYFKNYQTPAANRAFNLVVGSAARPLLKTPAARPAVRPRFSLPQSKVSPDRLAVGSPGPNDSYISTASSHDLTIHPRANASFDLISNTQGRLDRGKLQKQLNRINQMLTKENTDLLEEKADLEDANQQLLDKNQELVALIDALKEGLEQHEAHIDLLESTPDVPEDDKEDVYAELEAVAKDLEATQAENDQLAHKARDLEAALEKERITQQAAEEEFAAQQRASEADAERVVEDMTAKLVAREAQAKTLAKLVESKTEEIETLKDRLADEGRTEGDKIRRAEQKVEELRQAKDAVEVRVVNLEQTIDTLQARVIAQKSSMASMEGRLQRAESDLASEKTRSGGLQSDLQSLRATYTKTVKEYQDMEGVLEKTTQELATQHDELEDARERIASLEADMPEEVDPAVVREMEEQLYQAEREKARLERSAKRMESALEDADKRTSQFEEEKAAFGVKLAVLEREKNDLDLRLVQARHAEKKVDADDQISLLQHEQLITRLERELEQAHREIGRLRFRVSDSAGRKAIQAAKDEKIRLLEEQKKEQAEQISAFRKILGEHVSVWEENMSAMTADGAKSLRKDGSPLTPAIHRSLRSLKGTPRTPGNALRDASWANNSTPGIRAALIPLQHESAKLVQELQAANDRLDAKFDELQRAGSKNIALTRNLDDAKDREAELKTDLERVLHREERLVKRLERCKCPKCGRRFDASSTAKRADESSRDSSLRDVSNTSEIKGALASKNAELVGLKAQLEMLEGEKQTLQEAASQYNVDAIQAKRAGDRARQATEMLRVAKEESEQLRIKLEAERNAAQATADELQRELVKDRARLQELEKQQARFVSDIRSTSTKLKQKEADMSSIRTQLGQAKQRSEGLEEELKANKSAGRKSVQLEQKLAENQQRIEQLRKERDNVAHDYAHLEEQFAKSSQETDDLRKQLATAEAKMNQRRHQIDLQIAEGGNQPPARSRPDQRSDVVVSLEGDLRKVRREVEGCIAELGDLRSERDNLQAQVEEKQNTSGRSKTQLESQIRLLQERVTELQHQAEGPHVCHSESRSVMALQAQHKEECKGLLVQIQYLRHRVTRESAMRDAVAYQKTYLLSIISVMEKSEHAIVALIARTGFPGSLSPPPRRRSLKQVAVAVVFVVRAQRASSLWREQCAPKQELAAALEEVRRKRAAPGRRR